jgi:hypothetical protein
MPHTFDIRFDRTEGLAALLEAPTNSFRWKGSGRLSIDAQGISIAVRRGLLSLLARDRTRRIPAANLKEVFREGAALRVEFATDQTPRAALRFWAGDRATAAQIVQLLPTLRTIELEENATSARFRVNWRALALLGGALTAAVLGIVTLESGRMAAAVHTPTAAVSLTSTPPLAEPDMDAPVALAAAAAGPQRVTLQSSEFPVRVPADEVVPIVYGMASYPAARRQMLSFIEESEHGQWWKMAVRIKDSPDFYDPALWPLREAELAASQAWLNYYQFFAGSGLDRDGSEREYARMMTRRVYQYVD